MDHYRRTIILTIARGVLNDLLEALSPGVGGTGAAILDAAELVAYVTGSAPTPDSVLADFTLSDLTATPAALTFVGPVNLPGERKGIKATATFIAGAAPTQETLLGYLVTNGAGTAFWAGEEFADPVPIAAEDDFLEIDVIFALPLAWETGVA